MADPITIQEGRKPEIFISVCFILYLLFIIYGSLVPFKFNHISFQDAWIEFLHLQFMSIDHISRIDWSTNIMLGIPASFIGMAVFFRVSGLFATFFITCSVFTICLLTSSSAEFFQFFFSSRVPSMNDIVAQVIGETFGFGCWFIFGKKLIHASINFVRENSFSSRLQFLFWGYIILILLYNLMPLDLSLSPADIYHKWQDGHINLIPFGYHVGSISQLIYDITIDILTWVPAAFFLVKYEHLSTLLSTLTISIIALCIESAQLLILSRITDITDIITAIAGGYIGSVAGSIRITGKATYDPDNTPVMKTVNFYSGRVLTSLILFTGWALIILAVYWFPYDFIMDKPMIKERLHNLSFIPFKNYQINGIFDAITQLFRKILFFAPSGIILSWLISGKRIFSDSMKMVMVFLWFSSVCGIAGIGEVGQFFLPEKTPDLTDVMLECIGFWAGFILSSSGHIGSA